MATTTSTADSSRKLASIRTVAALQPIPKADRIEVAVVDGWKCVVKKGEFTEGETVVYCEIDSFLPIRPEFEFLRKSSYKKLNNGDEGFRLRTVTLRGQISQGLLLPLTILDDTTSPTTPQLGDDVTERLGIQKYETEPDLGAEHLAPFPSWIPPTDAVRVQNMDLAPLHGTHFHVSEKVDGTSCTVFWDGTRCGVCSRNHEIIGGHSPHAVFFASAGLEQRLPEVLGPHRRLAIQGELLGPKIQTNRYALKEVNLYVFSIWDMDAQAYLEDIAAVATEQLGLPTVPEVFRSVALTHDTDAMLALAEAPSALNSKIEREGLVWIQGTEWGRISIKAISNAFLTKTGS